MTVVDERVLVLTGGVDVVVLIVLTGRVVVVAPLNGCRLPPLSQAAKTGRYHQQNRNNRRSPPLHNGSMRRNTITV